VRRILVIVNPYATAVTPAVRAGALRMLSRGFELEAVDTEMPGHAAELARGAAGEGWDAVAALGGDGTINEAANGLTSPVRFRTAPRMPLAPGDRRHEAVGPAVVGVGAAGRLPAEPPPGRPAGQPAQGRLEVALANGVHGAGLPARPPLVCIPGGQANVLVRMLGMPTTTQAACEHIVALAASWPRRRIDLGVVNDRRFTFSSGVGVDASVTQAVDARPRLKARFGAWYYSWAAASIVARRYLAGAPRMTVRVRTAGGGEEVIEGMTTVVQNGSPYTYFNGHPIEMADGAALDSGSLAGGVLRRARARDVPSLAWRSLSSRARVSEHPQVSGFSGVRELTVTGAGGARLPVHVDGDYLGELPEARYSVLPGALELVARRPAAVGPLSRRRA